MGDDAHENLSKTQLRMRCLKNRRVLPRSERRIKDAIIAHKVARFLTHLHTTTDPLQFGAYLPFEDEVSILPQLSQLLGQSGLQHRCALPYFRMEPQSMKFYLPSSQDLWLEFVKLAQGGSAWVYPDPTLWYPADPDSLKIWLVPGIAFTPEGSRIGFGQGHYDAWLGNQKGIFVGLAYELQIVSGFNPEPFDIPMDIVITESHSYVRPETSAELEVIRGGLL